MEINRQGLTLHLIVHPIVVAQRDAQGRLQSLQPPATSAQDAATRESWMHVEVDRLVDAQQRGELLAGLQRVLGDVRVAVRDWKADAGPPARGHRRARRRAGRVAGGQVAESRAFLQWLADDHLTLLGYRRQDLVDRKRRGHAAPGARQRAWACSPQGAPGENDRMNCRRASPPFPRRCARWRTRHCRCCW